MLNKLVVLIILFSVFENSFAVTCPGFPGYCSESHPGQTCVVVCARGRNNVPLCQTDGTWTDIPRCIEHEPGIEEQLSGTCPGIPGYCSETPYGGKCEFPCSIGPHINSFCTTDGTWDPYPTCVNDIRETQDGCDPCPGPLGKFRNRREPEPLQTSSSSRHNLVYQKPRPTPTRAQYRPLAFGNEHLFYSQQYNRPGIRTYQYQFSFPQVTNKPTTTVKLRQENFVPLRTTTTTEFPTTTNSPTTLSSSTTTSSTTTSSSSSIPKTRRVFNPQTGEYVEIPIKKSVNPLIKEEPQPRFVNIDENKDSFGPFELLDLSESNSNKATTEGGLPVFEAIPGAGFKNNQPKNFKESYGPYEIVDLQ